MGVCFEDMVYALHTLRIIKLARDAGNPGFTGALDEYMDVLMDALYSAAEFCRVHGDDYGECEMVFQLLRDGGILPALPPPRILDRQKAGR